MTTLTTWIQVSPEAVLAIGAALMVWALLATVLAWRSAPRTKANANEPPSSHSLDLTFTSLRAQLAQIEEALSHLSEAQAELKQGVMDVALALGQERRSGAGTSPSALPTEQLNALIALNATDQPELLNQALRLLQHAEPQQVSAFESLLSHAAEFEQRRVQSHKLAQTLAAAVAPDAPTQGPGRLAAWQRLERLSNDLQGLMDLADQALADLGQCQQWLASARSPSNAETSPHG